MPSACSTLAVVAALVYGTSVLALPLEKSYDLVERDYSDIAELDARMYDMDLEEYYVREGGATPTASAPTTPVHHHKHKGHHHKPGHKSLYSHVTKEPTIPSPNTATSKLSTREPKGGRGRGGKGRRGRGRKGRGRKGKGKGGAPPADAAAAPVDASAAEPPAARDLEADDEILSAREPRGGTGHGGKGFKGRGRKGMGRKVKGGGPSAHSHASGIGSLSGIPQPIGDIINVDAPAEAITTSGKT